MGPNSPRYYSSQNLQLNHTEDNQGLQQRCSQWYSKTSGKTMTGVSCLGSDTQASQKQVLALRCCSHRGPAMGTALRAHSWSHAPLLNSDTSQGQSAAPNLPAISHGKASAALPAFQQRFSQGTARHFSFLLFFASCYLQQISLSCWLHTLHSMSL